MHRRPYASETTPGERARRDLSRFAPSTILQPVWLRTSLTAVLLVACSDPPQGDPDAGATRDADVTPDAGVDLPPAADMRATADTDGDGLLDVEEGYADGRGPDTDGDGTPDGEDLDSDADGLEDAVEALPRSAGGEPSDADGDGTPDFRDPDCDANGRQDGVDAFASEGAPGDLDGDGVADLRDPDDDGDGLLDTMELGADPARPQDSERDGTPDFRDRDSDGDTILDAHEYVPTAPDWDGDRGPNYLDLDSDGDGAPDAEEAGDADLETFPVDTDLDGDPDFLDADADDDGLMDDVERELGLSPLSSDTDGDGVFDVVEAVAGSDGLDGDDTPASRGWLVAIAPFRQPASPELFAAGVRYEVGEGEAPLLVRLTNTDVSEGAQFIERVEVDRVSPGCDDVRARDADGDGLDDAFATPPGGSQLCWTVTVRPNRTVPALPREHPVRACRVLERGNQLFEASIDVRLTDGGVESTRFLALVPWDSELIGPDDPRCFSCGLPEECLTATSCPCR